MQEMQVREKHANFTLVIVSILIVLLVCEFASRGLFEWREGTRWERPSKFAVYSDSVWEYNAELGYDYVPQARMDIAWMQNGVPRRCGTVVTGPLGAPGKGIDVTKVKQAKFIVLGDSVTATVHEGETWPDILSALIEERSGRGTAI